MRHRCSLLFFLFAVLAAAESIPGDFDDDGYVGLADLQMLCADWLSSAHATPADMDCSGTVDLADFALFSATWRTGYVNKPPVVADMTLTCVQDRSVEIYLTGTDDLNQPLTYSITTQPQKGILGKRSNDHYIYYAGTESDGAEVLQYTAHDGQLESEPATITIQIAAPLLDTLYLKSGAVIIYDGHTIQFDDSWTLCFWVRTLFDTGVIASKMDTGGVGFTLLLKEGKACLYLYDRNGAFHYLRTETKLNDGQWAMIAITHRALGEIIVNPANEYEERATTGLFVHNWMNDSYDFAVLPNLDIASNADLFYAGGYGNWFYPGQIDGVSFYESGLSLFESALVFIEGRILKTHALSPRFKVRYPINEGNGSVVYSTDMQYTGIVQPFFEWAPEDHLIMPVGDMRLRRRGAIGEYMMDRR